MEYYSGRQAISSLLIIIIEEKHHHGRSPTQWVEMSTETLHVKNITTTPNANVEHFTFEYKNAIGAGRNVIRKGVNIVSMGQKCHTDRWKHVGCG